MAITIPVAAVVSAAGIPIWVATCPHKILPSAIPPMNTTTNAARPRARTHSGKVNWAETCSEARIAIQATPVASIATASNPRLCKYASASAASA